MRMIHFRWLGIMDKCGNTQKTSSPLSLSVCISLLHGHLLWIQNGSSSLSLSFFPYPLSRCNLVTSLRPSFPDRGLYSSIALRASKQSFCVSGGGGPLIRLFSFFHDQMINLHKFKIKSFSLTEIITLIIATQITVSSE